MEFREPAEVRLVRIPDDASKAGESDAVPRTGEPVGTVTTIVDAESELIQGRVNALSTFALVEPHQEKGFECGNRMRNTGPTKTTSALLSVT